MQITKTHKIIISAVAVVVLLAGYIYFDRKSKEQVTSTDTNQVATTTGQNPVVNSKNTGKYTIEAVPLPGSSGVSQGIPDLNRSVRPTGSVAASTDAIVRATQEILPLQAKLKKDPSDFSAWLNLAIYQKMAGDYEGAVLSWQYASKIAPTDYIALGNLGNLYAYFLKDNVKSEMYYKEAISRAPMQAYLYEQLGEVYRDILKDKIKALAITELGLSKIPGDQNLIQLKASLQ